MSKSGKLKNQLKSAQRRRRRRPVPSGSAIQAVASIDPMLQSGVDVAGIISDAILITAEKRGNLRDSAVLGSLKALKGIAKANSEAAQDVLDNIQLKLDEQAIPPRERIAAANEMLKLADSSIDPKVPDQLIRFLSLLDV